MRILSVLLAFSVLLWMGCGSDDVCDEEQKTLEAYISDEVTGDDNLQTYSQNDTTFQYIIREPGDPDKVPSLTDSLIIEYVGRTTDGNIFDQRTAGFASGLRGLIVGWQIGVPLIGEGGDITLFLPPNLAYGSRQNGNICPNSPLIFDIKLEEVRQ